MLVVPGNHDIEWWKSPLGLLGEELKYQKYLRYFRELRPVLEIPGAVLAGALSSYGVAFGSLTWNIRDVAVKGHLPRSETDRVAQVFAKAPPGAARVLVFHHNVLPGVAVAPDGTRQLALGVPPAARDRRRRHPLRARSPGGRGQIEGTLAVSTSGTHSHRVRGGRPSVFNLVTIEPDAVHIRHYRWAGRTKEFTPSDTYSFARAGPPKVAVSVAGGDQGL